MGKDRSGQQEMAETLELQLWLRQQKMAAVDDLGSGRRQWQWQTMTVADDEGGGQQWHARLGGGLREGRRRASGKQQRH